MLTLYHSNILQLSTLENAEHVANAGLLWSSVEFGFRNLLISPHFLRMTRPFRPAMSDKRILDRQKTEDFNTPDSRTMSTTPPYFRSSLFFCITMQTTTTTVFEYLVEQRVLTVCGSGRPVCTWSFQDRRCVLGRGISLTLWFCFGALGKLSAGTAQI